MSKDAVTKLLDAVGSIAGVRDWALLLADVAAAREQYKKMQVDEDKYEKAIYDFVCKQEADASTIAALKQRVEELEWGSIIFLNEGESILVEGLRGKRVKVALDGGALSVCLGVTATEGGKASTEAVDK